MTPNSLDVQPGQSVGVFVRGEASDYRAMDCDVITPQTMRGAAARQETGCPRPQILTVRALPSRGSLTRILVSVRVQEGRLDFLSLHWGDGHRRRVDLDGRRTITLRLGHRYRKAGRYRVALRARAKSMPTECGSVAISAPAVRRIRAIR